MFSIAWSHIRRYPYQAVSVIAVLALTFFVISRVTLILIVSELTLRNLEGKPQITLFLKDKIEERDIQSITKELKNNPKVLKVKYVSKEDALKIYREQNKKDPLLLEMVTANILPASIEASTIKIEDLSSLAKYYKNNPAVEEISFQQDVVRNLSRWAKAVREIGLEHIGSHLLLSLFVIILFISAKIAVKKQEIEILQLLGASRSYIRTPFILEGMFYGFLSSFLATAAFLAVILSGHDPLNIIFNDLSIGVFEPSVYALYFGVTIGLGLILGWLSSLIAVFRFLK